MKKRIVLAALLVVPMGIALAESVQEQARRIAEKNTMSGRPVTGTTCPPGAVAGVCIEGHPARAIGEASSDGSIITGQPYTPDSK